MVALASCQGEDIPGTQIPEEDGMPIEFSGIQAWLETKADETETLPDNFTSFKVWASRTIKVNNADQTNYNVFSSAGTEVTKSEDAWIYSPVRYWQPGSYNFYAVSPADLATGNLSADGLTLSFGNNGWDLSSNQTDLLLATIPDVTGRFNTDNTPAPVKLTFNHMLSKISFKARNAESRNIAIAVTGIKIYGNSKTATGVNGKYENDTFCLTWALENQTKKSSSFKEHTHIQAVSLPKTMNNSQYEYAEICSGFMVFPEEKCNLTIEVTLTQTFGDVTGGTTTMTKTATIEKVSWYPGYVYDYKLTVTADTIALDNEPDVTPWDNNKGTGGYDADDEIEF